MPEQWKHVVRCIVPIRLSGLVLERRIPWLGALRRGSRLKTRIACRLSPIKAAALVLAGSLPCQLGAQSVISLRPGLIHYTEGKVLLSGAKGQQGRRGRFVHLRTGQRLSTKGGHAELVLLPGAFLRQDDNSEIEMLSAKSSGVELRLISGSIFVHIADNTSKDLLTLKCGASVVKFEKRGLYRCDDQTGEVPSLRVYRGKASVSAFGQQFYLKSKRSMPVAQDPQPLLVERFNRSKKDAFAKWNQTRANAIAEILRDRDASQRGFSWPSGTTGRSRMGRSRPATTTRPPKDSTGEDKPEPARAAQLNANSPATGQVPPAR